MEMVRLFAERINLFGKRDDLINALNSRRYGIALEICNEAIRACVRAGLSSGMSDDQSHGTLDCRQLYHLYQMLENFIVCLDEPQSPLEKPLTPSKAS